MNKVRAWCNSVGIDHKTVYSNEHAYIRFHMGMILGPDYVTTLNALEADPDGMIYILKRWFNI